MFGLVAGVKRFVIAGARLPHFPEDFEPALAETAQRAGVALAFGAMGLVVGLCPRAGLAAVIGPLMDGAAQGEVAAIAQTVAQDLTRLDGDGRGAGMTLQALRPGEAIPLVSDLGQEAGRELRSGSGEGAEEVAVGMLGEERFDGGQARGSVRAYVQNRWSGPPLPPERFGYDGRNREIDSWWDWAQVIDGAEQGYLRAACDYVHLNPVRAKMIALDDALESWRWSSYPEYLREARSRAAWLRTDRLLGEHGIQNDGVQGRRELRRRTEARRLNDNEDKEAVASLRRGWRVGAEDFVDRLLELAQRPAPSGHGRRVHEETEEAVARRILAEELQQKGWSLAKLKRRGKKQKGVGAHY